MGFVNSVQSADSEVVICSRSILLFLLRLFRLLLRRSAIKEGVAVVSTNRAPVLWSLVTLKKTKFA